MPNPASWIPPLCLFVAAFATTLAVTPLARIIAWKLGAVDYPGNRRINCSPVPRMGGIAVFCGILAAVGVQAFGSAHLGWPIVTRPGVLSVNYPLLALAFVIIFATGAIDDVVGLKPKQKLFGQALASVIAVLGGLVIHRVVNPFTDQFFELGWFSFPLTVVYLVAYTNIINLIDGLDGLASGITCISSITMFALSVSSGYPDAATLAIAMAGSTLAFLQYNFHPASIFLGDSGSLLLGFGLGTISLLSVTRIASLTTLIVPLVIVGIPIIDTLSAIIRRRRAHVSIGQADRGHIHHRLIDEGFDQRQAVIVMYSWTAILSVGSIAITKVGVVYRIVIFCVLVAASAAVAWHLKLFQPVLLHHVDPETGDDELIDPRDPSFEEEEQRLEENEPHLFHHS